MSALNLTNTKTEIFNNIYLIRNNTIQSIYDIFNDGTDISDNYYDKPTIDTKLLEKANVITLNNFMTNTNSTLALKAPISNPTFLLVLYQVLLKIWSD